MANQGVETTHPEYDKNIAHWQRIDDVINSDVNQYLRNVGKSERCPKYGSERQKEYEDGAILMNFTDNTREGMLGMIFMNDPQIDLPPNLEYLETNCDGNGLTLKQQSQEAVDQDVRKGRGGLLAEFPTTETTPSLEQIQNGVTVPYILNYNAQDIINWRTRRIGSVNKLVMVVLREKVDLSETDTLTSAYYENVDCYQYRALMLDMEGYYYQRVYSLNEKDWIAGEDVYPKQNGQRMKELPFYFYGSKNNDFTVDPAPLLSIVDLNIGHYRNSADSEESIHLTSQAMLVIAPGSNMNPKAWLEANPDGVKVGSRSGLNVGDGGSAQFIQAPDTSAASNGMIDKENKAVAIGAQLITPSQQITAESARIQQGSNASVLSNISTNVTSAFRKAITQCSAYLGNPNPEFDFELNNDFFMDKMSAQERAQWVSEIQIGISPKTLYYKRLRETGEYPDDWKDEDIQEAIEDEGMDNQGLMGDTNGNQSATE